MRHPPTALQFVIVIVIDEPDDEGAPAAPLAPGAQLPPDEANPPPPKMRTLIFGDVHGCNLELRTLVDLFAPSPTDRLVSVGDLIKKGPDSVDVIRFLRSWQERGVTVEHVLGNHEGHLRRAVSDVGVDRLPRDTRSIASKLTPDELDWLLGAPLHRHYPELDARVLHAGVMPEWTDLPSSDPTIASKKDAQRMDELLRMRSIAGPGPRRKVTKVRANGERGRTLYLAMDLPLPKAPSGGRLEVEEVDVAEGSFLGLREIGAGDVNWPTLYDGRFGHIFFGHQPFLDHDAPVRFPHATALDLGCVYGNALVGMVLEVGKDPEALVVPAVKEHSHWGF